jgi:hypothetical protein
MYVADAHALAWYFTDDPHLGREAADQVPFHINRHALTPTETAHLHTATARTDRRAPLIRQ